jgi:hypothetical protein
VWLTRLLYHNGLALWASILFYESCLSVIIGLIYSDMFVVPTACLIGCLIFLAGLIFLSLLENLFFVNALAFTLSPWAMFMWLLGGLVIREYDDKSSTLPVVWFVRFVFCSACALTLIRLTLFLRRYKHKSIPTFQTPRIHSFVDEPRVF